jgi:RNA polymerase sigma-70 factor (ECF subfamily)
LRVALAALAVEEREAIEAAFLHGLSYADAAAKCGETIGTIKRRIRSGLSTLQLALQDQGNKS